MKNYLKLSAWLFLIPALMFSSCKDDDKSDGDPLLAPRNLVGLAGDGQGILNWDAPLSGEVKEYSVTWTPGNGSATVSGMAYTATGLTNDTEYTFSVKAVYASGSSDALTVKKTPKTEAINYTACTDVAAQAGYKAITLTWAVPEIVPKAELSGYTITVAPGEMVAIVGQSGSGKTTLLNLIGGIEHPTSGSVEVGGVDICSADDETLSGIRRRKLGYIFQDFNLFDHLTAEENVSIALRKVMGCNKAEARNRALTELSRVGLAKRAALYPAQLSGGQKQRVAIARALAMDPKVMLLDEPTSALDPELVGEVLSVIRDLADGGMTMIMATHQMDFARALATDILFMEQGKIIEQGAPDVLLAPGSGTRTSDFCGKLFDLRGTEKSDEPTVSELLTGDLSHDITDDGSESSMIPDAPKKD